MGCSLVTHMLKIYTRSVKTRMKMPGTILVVARTDAGTSKGIYKEKKNADTILDTDSAPLRSHF